MLVQVDDDPSKAAAMLAGMRPVGHCAPRAWAALSDVGRAEHVLRQLPGIISGGAKAAMLVSMEGYEADRKGGAFFIRDALEHLAWTAQLANIVLEHAREIEAAAAEREARRASRAARSGGLRAVETSPVDA